MFKRFYLFRLSLGVVQDTHGFSLVSALITVAIIAFLSLTIGTVSTSLSRAIVHANRSSDILNLGRFVQSVMGDPLLCGNALRSNGAPLAYNGSAPVTFDSINGNGFTIRTNQPLNSITDSDAGGGSSSAKVHFVSNLAISKMTLSPKQAGLVGSTMQTDSGTYNTYIANLALEFKAPDGASDSTQRPLNLTVEVAALQGTNTVSACPNDVNPPLAKWECSDVTNIQDQAKACPASNPQDAYTAKGISNVNCKQVYSMSFDASGVPTCECKWACAQTS